MYSARKRPEDFEHQLRDLMVTEYGLQPTAPERIASGFYGEVWKITEGENDFVIKLDASPQHQMTFHRNLPILPHLRAHGIQMVPQALRTQRESLSVFFGGGVLAVFSFMPGASCPPESYPGLFDSLARVYDVPTPAFLWHENFAPQVEREVAIYITALSTFPGEAAQSLYALLREKIPLISRYAARLQYFTAKCEKERDGFVITHGDPLRNALCDGERVSLIDWDETLYAPPERDAWLFLDLPEGLTLFEEALRARNIVYKFREERLAYYGYYMFFQYLREALACFFGMQEEIDPWIIAGKVREFFDAPAIKTLALVAEYF